VTGAGWRAVASGMAAAGLLAGLAVAGPELLPAVALACALLAIAARPHWHTRRDLPAALAAVAWLVSALLAPRGATTIAAATPMLACVLVVCGTARLPPGRARALFAGCLAMAVLILALVAGFELAKLGELRSTAYPGLAGWGGFPEVGLLGVMTLPVALSLAIGGGPRGARAGAVVATLTAAAGVGLSASRAAWGAALVGTVLVVVARRRSQWRTMVAAAIGVMLLATLVVVWLRPQPAGGAVPVEVAMGSRLEAWSQAARLWRERPLIGWGPASYRQVYGRHFEQPADALPADAQFHAHNAYLNLAVETGVLGVVSVLWFAAVVVAGTGGRSVPGGTLVAAARTGLACGLIAVAVRFLIDYFDPAGAGMRVMLWLSILAGLRLALDVSRDRASA
jgi:O-antigen ligase